MKHKVSLIHTAINHEMLDWALLVKYPGYKIDTDSLRWKSRLCTITLKLNFLEKK